MTGDSGKIAMCCDLKVGSHGGTMRWQAPELLRGDAEEAGCDWQRNSQASDIYAFACVCYEVRPPFQSAIALNRLRSNITKDVFLTDTFL